MTNEPIHPGGLLRCCLSHITEVRSADPKPPAEEAFETCRYCGAGIVWFDNQWYWERSAELLTLARMES